MQEMSIEGGNNLLDAIDARLKDVIVGRCGYMASVVSGGEIRPGMSVLRVDGQIPAERKVG